MNDRVFCKTPFRTVTNGTAMVARCEITIDLTKLTMPERIQELLDAGWKIEFGDWDFEKEEGE